MVPAYPDPYTAGTTEGDISEAASSISPEPMEDIQQEEEEPSPPAPASKRRRPPPSVDFTGYDPIAIHADKEDIRGPSMSEFAREAQKATEQAQRMSINAITNVDVDEQKAERRAALVREAEAMRVSLKAKEKELEELG